MNAAYPDNPRVLSVATALPRHRVTQQTAKEFGRAMFSGTYRDVERLLPLFDTVGVEWRNFCVPPEWFYEDHSFTEKNDLYIENALDLSEKAARRALDRAGVSAEEVGAIFFVSTTGLSTPSIDARLLPRLGLPEHTRRVPVWGLGCAAGAGGFALAADHARLYRGRIVLFVAVELCGLTFQYGDRSKASLVSVALFSDGAAAVVLDAGQKEPSGPEILGSHNTTWRGTDDVMGWEIQESGLKVVLSRSVPDVVRQRAPENLRAACASVGLVPEDLQHFVTHPGGAKVLDAFEEVLGMDQGGLHLSRDVLREQGNMSSVTVLAILERLLDSGETEPGDLGVISALGPGFSAEHVFFRC